MDTSHLPNLKPRYGYVLFGLSLLYIYIGYFMLLQERLLGNIPPRFEIKPLSGNESFSEWVKVKHDPKTLVQIACEEMEYMDFTQDPLFVRLGVFSYPDIDLDKL